MTPKNLTTIATTKMVRLLCSGEPCDLEVAGPFTSAFEVVAQSYVPPIAVRVPFLWIVVAGILWRVRGVGETRCRSAIGNGSV